MRSNSERVDRAIRRALNRYVLDADAPANYSVRVAVPSSVARNLPLSLLYRSTLPVVRTRRPLRVLHALVAHLSAHLGYQADRGLVRVSGLALVSDAGAIVAPSEMLNHLPQLEPRMRALGMRLADVPFVSLDCGTGDLVVPHPQLEVDTDAFEELEEELPTRVDEDEAVAPGRYPVRAWGFLGMEGRTGAMSRANGVASAMATLHRPPLAAQPLLDLLAQVLTQATPVLVPPDVGGFATEMERLLPG